MDATRTAPAVREPGVSTAGPPGVHPRPATSALAGLVILLLGAWGAIIAYIGPSFGYGPAGSKAWQWTTTHTVLNLIPGAVAAGAGLLLLLFAAATARKAMLGLMSLLVLGAGAWFVLGPFVYPVFYNQVSGYSVPTAQHALATFATWLGWGPGVGVALAALSGVTWAMASGRMAMRVEHPAVVGHRRFGRRRRREPVVDIPAEERAAADRRAAERTADDRGAGDRVAGDRAAGESVADRDVAGSERRL